MRLLPAGAGAAAASGLPQRASLSRAAPCVRGKCPRARVHGAAEASCRAAGQPWAHASRHGHSPFSVSPTRQQTCNFAGMHHANS